MSVRFGSTICLKSNVLIIVYLMVISSILQKYVSSPMISTTSPSFSSLVYKIIMPAIILPNISLKASHTPNDIHPMIRATSSPIISNPINSANITEI